MGLERYRLLKYGGGEEDLPPPSQPQKNSQAPSPWIWPPPECLSVKDALAAVVLFLRSKGETVVDNPGYRKLSRLLKTHAIRFNANKSVRRTSIGQIGTMLARGASPADIKQAKESPLRKRIERKTKVKWKKKWEKAAKKKRFTAIRQFSRLHHEDPEVQKERDREMMGREWLREHDPKYKKLARTLNRLH